MLAILIEYDGTDYAGWQRQPNGPTVQQMLEESCSRVFGSPISVVGSGRTDAGVHASGQVAHADISSAPNKIPLHKIAVALNTNLPADIRVRKALVLDHPFHARYDAIEREYEYHITLHESVFSRRFAWSPPLPFDISKMHEAAKVFLGTHDFTTYSKHNPSTHNYTCTVNTCSVELATDRVVVRICANRFVYGMCRSIVGALYAVSRGRTTNQELIESLALRNRVHQEFLAPPHGLVLKHVRYERDLFGLAHT